MAQLKFVTMDYFVKCREYNKFKCFLLGRKKMTSTDEIDHEHVILPIYSNEIPHICVTFRAMTETNCFLEII